MKKILFSDLDGTLINKQHQELHPGNFEAIKKWREAGNLFVLCTGRNQIDIMPTLDQADIEFDYLVLCNGASFYNNQMECIYEKEFPLEIGKEILLSCAKEKNLMTFYCDQNELVMCKNNKMNIFDSKGTKDVDKTKTFEDYVKAATCFKMLCLVNMEDEEDLYRVQDELLLPYQDQISWFFNVGCIDIMAEGVSKGNGMAKMVEMLGIEKENVYAIGDSFNDLSMIELASHGTTFPHCPEILRRKAKHIVSSERELIELALEDKLSAF